MPDRLWTVTRTWQRVHADSAGEAVESTMGRLHDDVNAREGDFPADSAPDLLGEVFQLRQEVNALRQEVNNPRK